RVLRQKKLARGKRRQTVRLALPGGSAPGPHTLAACADPRKKIRERNERNNCRRVTITVPGTPVPSPPGPKPTPTPTPRPSGDHTAPDTIITAGPPSFEFPSTETGSTFQ